MQRRYVRLADTQINTEDHGGEGPPVLLVHGLGGSAGNWELVAPALASHARVLAIDLPGHGRSGPVRKHTLETHVATVSALISSQGWDHVTLVGSSMGGLISILVARDHPHTVDAMVLLSPATPPVTITPPRNPRASARLVARALPGIGPVMTRMYVATRTPEEQIDETLDIVMSEPARLPDSVRANMIELARLRRTMPWAIRAFAESAASIRRSFTLPASYRATVDAVQPPTTLIFGTEDHVVVPESMRWLARRRPDWRSIELPDVGHTPIFERPDIVVRETLRRMNVPERPGGRGFPGEFGHFYPSAAGTLA